MESHGNRSGSQARQSADGDRRAKKAYRTPKLTEYGSVAKLTQSNAGSGADGGRHAAQMKACL